MTNIFGAYFKISYILGEPRVKRKCGKTATKCEKRIPFFWAYKPLYPKW